MPLGMRELKCLQTLSNFIVGKCVGSGLIDLKNLKFLQGKLCISRLENVIDFEDTREAILNEKRDLEVLSLEWDSQFSDSRNGLAEKDVLDMLQPSKNLKELIIKGYSGTIFPYWMGDPSFSNIAVLRLESCKRCTFLPLRGRLSSLKDLTIKGMTGLKTIGSEFYGGNRSKPFQSLETLCFEDLQEWEHWDPIKKDEHVEIFSHLRELSIMKCPKLSGRLPENLPSLEKLVISECSQLAVSFSSLPLLCKLKIERCKGIACSRTVDMKSLESMTVSNISECGHWLRQTFQKLECLKIFSSQQFLQLWQNEICPENPPQPRGLHNYASIRKLYIRDCPDLVSLPAIGFLSALNELEIVNCTALISLPQEMNYYAPLERLRIRGCHSLMFIVRGQLPSSIKSLEVKNCEKLQCLFNDREDTCMVNKEATTMNNTSTSLEYLHISECPSLICISSRGQLPATLEHLDIQYCSELTTILSSGQLPLALKCLEIFLCPKLESIAQRFQNNPSLGVIRIWYCKNLKSIPQGLHNLHRLRQLCILNCPSLVSFPEGGLPHTNLHVSIQACDKLEALPAGLYNLNSIQRLDLRKCPSIVSFPEEGLPTNLTSLSIEDLNIYESLISWGLHKLTSLRDLYIGGCSDSESFPHEETGMMLPTSLTALTIDRFSKLKYLSSKSFQNLTSLEYLFIRDCPKLASFPKVGLPESLLQLYICKCPSLRKQCKRNKGSQWTKIANIPYVDIDSKFIYDEEEE